MKVKNTRPRRLACEELHRCPSSWMSIVMNKYQQHSKVACEISTNQAQKLGMMNNWGILYRIAGKDAKILR